MSVYSMPNNEKEETFDILDPQNWKSPNREEMLAWIERLQNKAGEKVRPNGQLWTLGPRIKPVSLYSYLKYRFGEPNGLAMIFREPSVDNLIHWNYTVLSGDCYLDISCLNTHVTILLTEKIAQTCEVMEDALLSEFSRCKKGLENTKRGFERWHLFVNPYHRLKRIVDQQESRLRTLNVPGMAVPSIGESTNDAIAFKQKMREITVACDEAMSLSIMLQMTAPVLGESLINFLLLLLSRPEIRNDKRMFESYTRQNIDVRIKSLPVVCIGFKPNVDFSSSQFKDFLRLMDNRNKRLHGNIDPTIKTGDEIYFDHATIPLFESQRSIPEFAMHAGLAHADPSDALADVTTTREFVIFLLDQLDENTRAQIEMVLETPQLGYRPEKNRIGIILPPHYVDMVMVPSTLNGEEP